MGTAASTEGRMSRPYATTTPSSGRTGIETSSPISVVAGRPSSRAAAFTGVGEAAGPRPRRRSGPLTTSATSCPAATSARSGGTASSGVPRKARRGIAPT